MKRVLLAASLFVLPLLARGGDLSLLDAIRAGDTATVRAQLAAGADVNVRDESGATALMYSAIYAPAETMRLLIDGGADANIPNLAGSTALMWAAGDAARVRMLLDAGALVRAKTASGVTPLLVAMRLDNVDAVRALLAAGADATTVTPAQTRVLWDREHGEDVRRLLVAAGAPPVTPDEATATLVAGAGADLFSTIPRIVAAGASPDAAVRMTTVTVPALGLVANGGDIGAVRAMLDRGVDPNARSSNGTTPLMLSAFSSRSSPELVRLLLARRADPAARDEAGRSALDWALTLGNTPIAQVLRAAGVPALSESPAAPPPAAHPRSARDAIAAALTRLEPAGPGFFNRTKCISCHNQSLPAIAAARAAAHGISGGAVAANAVEATLAAWRTPRENILLGQQAVGGFVANVTYGLVSLAETGTPASAVTDAVALRLAAAQHADGTWMLDDLRPPLGDLSPMPSTALAIRGLGAYTPNGRRAEVQLRLDHALEFVRAFDPRSTQDEAFKLLALAWSHVPEPEIARQRERLLRLQRADGGWAQVPTLAPDAYATGQALFALSTGGVRGAAEPYTRGTEYLLRTQLDDGTWFVRTRALGFQAYFETGFPHGRNQFISAAATSWAAIALSATLP